MSCTLRTNTSGSIAVSLRERAPPNENGNGVVDVFSDYERFLTNLWYISTTPLYMRDTHFLAASIARNLSPCLNATIPFSFPDKRRKTASSPFQNKAEVSGQV